MKPTRLVHIFIIGFTALFVFALLPQSGFAGQSVDPSTLNPPPPPQFNPVCESTGNGTLCPAIQRPAVRRREWCDLWNGSEHI